jgi:hypothetical protein
MNDLGDLIGVELGDLESKLLHIHVVLMAIAAWFVLWALRKIWKGMDNVEWVKRLKPLYPLVLCEGFVWIPGLLPQATTGERILMAVWAGILAAIGYQLIRRIVRKVGVELPEDDRKLMPSDAPPAIEPGKKDEDDTTPVPQPEEGDKDDEEKDDEEKDDG